MHACPIRQKKNARVSGQLFIAKTPACFIKQKPGVFVLSNHMLSKCLLVPYKKKKRHMLLANCMLSKTPVCFITQKLCFSPTVCFQNACLSHTTKEKRTCFWPTVYCKNACLFHKTEARCLCFFLTVYFKNACLPVPFFRSQVSLFISP